MHIDQLPRRKAFLVLWLALAAAGLGIADRLLDGRPRDARPAPAAARQGSADVDQAIDTLLARYHVDPKTVRRWSILTPDKATLRREIRADVPPAFLSLGFNHDLSREVAPLGARVIATEHSKEQTVTMHVRKDGVVTRTLVFRTVPEATPKRRKGK